MVVLVVTAVEAPDSGITDSLRTTLHHIRTHAGLSFLFRGFPLFTIYAFTQHALFPVLASVLLPGSADTPLLAHLGSIISTSLLSYLQVLWIQTVITKPSSTFSHHQLPNIACWIRAAPIAVLEAAFDEWATYYSTDLAVAISNATVKLLDPNALLDPVAAQDIKRGYAPHILGLIPCFVTCMATLPVRISLIRIAASLLPEDEQLIVPLDPVLKENPPSGAVDAWKKLPGRTWARVWRVQARAYVASALIFFAGKMVYSEFHQIAHLSMIGFSNM